jgi:hypothetical protein
MHDCAENDWSNQHFDQLNETVTERFHLFSELRIEVTQQDAEDDRGQHLGIEMRIERLPPHRGESEKFCASSSANLLAFIYGPPWGLDRLRGPSL